MTKIQRGDRDAWVDRVVEAGAKAGPAHVATALARAVWSSSGWSLAYADVTAMTGLHRATVSRAVARLRAAGAVVATDQHGPDGDNGPKHYRLVLGFDLEFARAAFGGRPKPAGKRPPRSQIATGGGRSLQHPPGRSLQPLPSPDPEPLRKDTSVGPPYDSVRHRKRVRVAARSAYEYAASAARSPDADPGLATEDCVKPESQGDPEQRDRVDGVLARLAASKAPPARGGTTLPATLEQLVARADPTCVLCRGSGLVARGSTGLPCSCTSR